MDKKFDYYRYEDKIATAHLKKLDGTKTFKMGLELSEFAIKTSFASFKNQYKTKALEKFRTFLRKI